MTYGAEYRPRLPDALLPTRAAVLAAVIWLREEQRPITVRAVARSARTGVASAHRQLLHLRGAGLVAWDDGRIATIRPTVAVLPVRGDR